MKNKLIFLLLTLSIFMMSCGEKKPTYNVKVILYEIGEDNSYLKPIEFEAGFIDSIEYTVARSEIEKLKENNVVERSVKLKSAKRENTVVYLKINKEIGDMKSDKNLPIYAIVNAITEIPNTEKVVIQTNKASYTYIRNRNLLKRDKKLNPAEVLYKQMMYEKEGNFFNAYLLMSDEGLNPDKKSYQDYYKEILEVYQLGFTNQEFKVKEYNIEGNIAKVKVVFYTPEGEVPLQFRCVNIEGAWLVDWLTSQVNM